jgi:hypothetical protein
MSGGAWLAMERAEAMERRRQFLAKCSPAEREEFLRQEASLEEGENQRWRERGTKAKAFLMKLAKSVGWQVLVGFLSDQAKEGLRKLGN